MFVIYLFQHCSLYPFFSAVGPNFIYLYTYVCVYLCSIEFMYVYSGDSNKDNRFDRLSQNMYKTLFLLGNYNCFPFLSVLNKLQKVSLNTPLLQLTVLTCPNSNINILFLCELSFYSLHSFLV